MLLLITATETEMKYVCNLFPALKKQISFLVCGIGLIETTLRLTQFLSKTDNSKISAVINFGIAGAFIQSGVKILDTCIAEQEIIGDLGICLPDKIEDLPAALKINRKFNLKSNLTEKTINILQSQNISFKKGTFVTVNCSSGTESRGNFLMNRFQAICENMEGAAIARTCQDFKLPFLEIRTISNMVEDRNPENWRIKEALLQGSEIVKKLIETLILEYPTGFVQK
jgi:futalosine hydrolase